MLGALRGEAKTALLSPMFEPEGASGLWDGGGALCAEVEEVARGSFWRCEPSGDGLAPRSLEAALWAFAHSSTFEEGVRARGGGVCLWATALAHFYPTPRSAAPCLAVPHPVVE